MIDWTQFHFLRPEWFYALIPLIVVIVTVAKINRSQSGWQNVLPAHLYPHLVSGKANSKRRPPYFLVALAWVIAVGALAGPTWEKLPRPVFELSAGKVIVMDMSMSMRATDIKPNRLARAKFKTIDLINEIAEGDIGLVAYAGEAFRISPLSSDAKNLTTLLPSLSPEIMPVAGSDPLSGIKMAADLLESSGYVEGEIFWVTDGIEMSQVAELNQLISSLNYRISILGVGTQEGAPIQLLDGDFLKNNRGAIVIPKLDATQLNALASKSGGQYTNITADNSDIDNLVNQPLLKRNTESDTQRDDKFGDEWREDGPYLLLLLLPVAAFAFRRGYLTVFLLVCISSSFMPKTAYAVEWQDWFKNKNQQAESAFKQEDYEAASVTATDPLLKGAALYRQGDYQGALEAYSAVQSVQGHYNKGNALAQLGELKQAIEAYEKVLSENPEHADAAANKALVEKLLEQQQDSQDGDSNDSENNDEQQDSDQQQQDSEQQEQEQQQSQQSEQQSQSNESQQQSEQKEQEQQESEQQQDSESDNDEQTPQDSEPESESEQENEQNAAQQAEQSQQPMTDAEREQMQRLQNLLNKVPDDPAFLLKRKMILENQQRRRNRAPNDTKRTW